MPVLPTAILENSMEVSQKTKNRTTIWPSNSTPGYISKNNNNNKKLIWKDTLTKMFIAALFTMAKISKQLQCQSTIEWVKKIWYIYTMEYYSAIKNIFYCCCFWFGIISKKLPNPSSLKFTPLFSLYVLAFVFRSLIHFKLVFVYGMK